MNKHITKYLRVVSLFAFILAVLASSINYLIDYNNEQEKELSTLIKVMSKSFDQKVDRILYLEEIADKEDNLKIKYLSNNVKYDSEGSNEFKLIPGTYKHSSNQWTRSDLEVVKELKDGSLLSLTINKLNFLGIVFHLLPMYILLFGVIFIFTSFMSKKSVNRIMTPLYVYEKTGNIDNMLEVPELSSFVQVLSKEAVSKDKEIEEVKRERDTINTILSNMKEGLLILDSKRRILMLNGEASEILEAGEQSIGKSILYVTRREALVIAIEDCYTGNFSEGEIEVQDRYIKYYANPVYYNDEITGAVLLLIDETERIQAEKIREEFSANVSHELKTPLTSIYGFAELLSTNMITDEKDRKEIIERIFEEAKRLLTLIDEIIKISRLESGTQITEEEVELNSLAKRLYNHFETVAKDRNVTLNITGEGTFISNTTMIWELIANLIENAIKYNVDFGTVDVKMKVDKQAEFIVEDTGIGIDEKDLDRIFERFYRAEKSRNKKRGGTGLGLSIVKHIVKNLKGKVNIESEVGKGTKIHVTLPLKEI